MLSIKKISFSISLLFWVSNLVTAQSYQDEYLRKNQDSKSFDREQWSELKNTIRSESSGSTDNFGQNGEQDGSDAFNFETEDSEGSTGSNYDYEYEDYEGEYSNSDPDDPYDRTDYQRNNSYSRQNDNGSYQRYQRNRNRNPSYRPRTNGPRNKPLNSNNTQSSSGQGASFLEVLMWIVIIIGVAVLIYYFFINADFNEKGTNIEANFEEMSPSEIPKSELERRLEAALLENNYREAIRIYFIFTLKDLSIKHWISWEKEKTNISYLYEMRGKDQYHQFNEAVNIYDQVWYGKIDITQEQYQAIEPKYKSLLNSINLSKN